MGIFENYDIVTSMLMFSIILFIAIATFILSIKRYEIAISLILLSPFVHWIFTSNVPKSAEEMLEVGLGTYIRLSIVALIGAVGVFKFFDLRSTSNENLPFYLVFFCVLLFYALFSTIYSLDKLYTFVRSAQFIAFFGFLLGFHYWLRDTLY